MKKLLLTVFIALYSIAIFIGCASVKATDTPLIPVSYTMNSGEQSENHALLTVEQVKNGIIFDDYTSSDRSLFENERYNFYRIASDVFIRIQKENGYEYMYMYDSDGEWIRQSYSGTTWRFYKFEDNDDFDKTKKYRVYYSCNYDVYSTDFRGVNGIDFIEGLAPYEETLTNRRKAAEELRKQEMEKIYSDALATTGTAKIIEYINTYERDDNFNEDSYVEIARRIIGNHNVPFKEILNVPNPYAFDTDTVYYCSGLVIQNFIRGQIIVSMPSLYRGEKSLIVLRNVPDIIKLEDYITNAYLKYTGITTVSMSNGGTRGLATFTVIFNF